jgi:hypothetical protein
MIRAVHPLRVGVKSDATDVLFHLIVGGLEGDKYILLDASLEVPLVLLVGEHLRLCEENSSLDTFGDDLLAELRYAHNINMNSKEIINRKREQFRVEIRRSSIETVFLKRRAKIIMKETSFPETIIIRDEFIDQMPHFDSKAIIKLKEALHVRTDLELSSLMTLRFTDTLKIMLTNPEHQTEALELIQSILLNIRQEYSPVVYQFESITPVLGRIIQN